MRSSSSGATPMWTGPSSSSAPGMPGWNSGRDPASARPGRGALGIEDTRSVGSLSQELPRLLHGARRVHFRLEGRGPGVRGGGSGEAGVLEALRWSRTRGARTGSGPRGLTDPGVLLHELRLRKEPEEVQAIRQAVAASVAGFEAAFSLMRPGVGEWALEAALVAGFRRGGATGPAFAPIVASGPNGCVLHYVENQRRIRGPELVLMDAGAEVRLYAADISRTVPASGRFTPAQRDVYRCVEAARAAGVAAVAPGVPVDRVHRAALECLVEGLVELGVLEGDVEELLEAEAHRPFYPHQTSHWLGLDTHDPGDYAVSGSSPAPGTGNGPDHGAGTLLPTAPLAAHPGPGGEGDLAAPFRGTGIRIEDDVLVTKEGSEVLTAALPTDPDEVEARILNG
jgi:Xaa-Pro aminopeptidase